MGLGYEKPSGQCELCKEAAWGVVRIKNHGYPLKEIKACHRHFKKLMQQKHRHKL